MTAAMGALDQHPFGQPPLATIAPSPTEVAPDTWLIPELMPAEPGTFVMINSVVIRGAEPVIVDTGTARNRERWLDAVFGIVEPEDVRWVFISHDDHDHVGNLAEVLERCPAATLITDWFTLERLSGDVVLPLDRCRWVNDGEQVDVGDRVLRAVRPPVFDGPTTRGLFDGRTGFLWAVDSFASLVPGALTFAEDVPRDLWEATLIDFARMISPWHTLLDPVRYSHHVDRTAGLRPAVVASAHGPALRGSLVEEAFGRVRALPDLDAVAMPDQRTLDQLLAQAR